MADPIEIKIGLDASDIGNAQGKIRASVKSALDSALPDAKEVGKKIGNALADGMAEGIAKARQLRTQLDQILSPVARQRTNESAETKHQQKLNEIRERGAQQQASIAAKAAAQEATIRAKAAADAERDARRFAEAQDRIAGRGAPPDSVIAFFKRYSSTIREAGESIQQAGYGLLGLTAGILNAGKSAVTSAVNIDQQVNVLKALTGSAAEAEKRFASLTKLASQTPGLTTSLAATLDAQLRVANVSGNTIDKLLPAIGRLNAVSPLGDPQKFAQNLTQLITQGFERADLKELVGESPLAGEIIKSIFNVDSATNGKAIKESAKKLGITSTDAFFSAFAESVRTNPKFAGITESLGTQFEKLQDRIIVALRPLGLAIVEALKPLVDSVVPIIERLSAAFSALPQRAQQAIIVLGGLTAVIGPLVIALGGLIQTFGALGDIFKVIAGTGGAAGIGALLSSLLPIVAAIVAAVAALGVAWATNFGGIREITDSVVKEAIAVFQELRAFWSEIAPDLAVIGKAGLEALSAVFSAWSGTVGAVWSNTWDLIRSVVRESLDIIKPFITSVLALLQGDFAKFSEDARKVWSEAWDFIVFIPAKAFGTLVKIIEDGITSLLTTSGFAKNVGLQIGESLGQGVIDGFLQVATSSTTAATIRGVLLAIKGDSSGRDAARSAARAASIGRGNDGEEITASDLAQNQAFLLTKPTPSRTGLGGSGSSAAESKARQLREAQLSQQKSFIEQNQRLLEDANKRELESFKVLYNDKKISINEFYNAKLGLEQSSIGNSINNLNEEITQQERALAAAKAGTPEKTRLETELFKLRSDLIIKTRELTDAEVTNQREAVDALERRKVELLKETQGLALKVADSGLVVSSSLSDQEVLNIETQKRAAAAAIQFREKDLELQQQEIQIQNAIAAGVLTESQGKEATLAVQRQYRDVLIQSLEIQKAAINPLTDGEAFQRINVQIEQLKTLGQSLSPTQAFFKGFRSEAETLAESFERIGKSFKDSVLGVVDSGIDKLTQKLGFFKSLVGDILKSLTRVLLGGLLQPRGGTSGGSGGIGGVLGSILGGGGGSGGGSAGAGGGISGVLGKILGFGSSGGSGGFATGGFAGGGGAASILGGSGGSGILSVLSRAVGGTGANVGGASGGISGIIQDALGKGIVTPASLSLSTAASKAAAIPGVSGGGGVAGASGGLKSLFGGLGGGLGNLFKGIGFGQKAGSGGALAGALPLLGLSLGASVGTDKLTSIIGGVGGGLLGVGLAAAPAIFGAGGALASPALAALFSNPFTAIAGGALLVGALLLGRARQRKRDEKTSGDALQDAVDQIKDVRKQVESNELTLSVSDARKLFDSQILQPFIAQISQLKSKSVRESRLKNQTVDLRNLFEKEVIPAVQAQKAKQGINDKLIPEFALGGIVPGRPTPGIDSVLARLSPGEMVLTTNHQAMLQSIAGRNVFQAIGVPNSGEAVGDGSTAFASGGFVGAASRQVTTPTINMTVQLVVSGDEAVEILNAAASTDSGQQILVNARKSAQRNRLTR